jgi:hypothetical protein
VSIDIFVCIYRCRWCDTSTAHRSIRLVLSTMFEQKPIRQMRFIPTSNDFTASTKRKLVRCFLFFPFERFKTKYNIHSRQRKHSCIIVSVAMPDMTMSFDCFEQNSECKIRSNRNYYVLTLHFDVNHNQKMGRRYLYNYLDIFVRINHLVRFVP